MNINQFGYFILAYICMFSLVGFAAGNDSIPIIKALPIDSLIISKIPMDQGQVFNMESGEVYATLVQSRKKCNAKNQRKVLKIISKPKSFKLSVYPFEQCNYTLNFYTKGGASVVLMYNSLNKSARLVYFIQAPNIVQDISYSSPLYLEFQIQEKAHKKLLKVIG